jgi:hypothetical protein|tara:strand:+ start:44 stop:460 length:417 start_codon:yes stop_codon:yes gene_type:complete
MLNKGGLEEIKNYIEDILGGVTTIKNKLPIKKQKEKESFCDMLYHLQLVNDRTIGMKHDYKVDMMQYDDPFYTIIDSLLQLKYTQEQRNIINWWLYDKFLPSGEVLVLTHKETEEIIESETPSDVWDLIQEHSLKNNG